MVSTQIVRILSVALLSLSLLAGLASAECAWILWSTSYTLGEGKRPVSESTLPVSGYSSKRECDEVLARHDRLEDERRKKEPTKERYFACLPDTVDPRGPKGVGR